MKTTRRDFVPTMMAPGLAGSGAMARAETSPDSREKEEEKAFTHRLAFPPWMNDVRLEALPFSPWPAPEFDDLTVESILRNLELAAASGFTHYDIYGLFVTWSWPPEVEKTVDSERAQRVNKILQAARRLGLQVVYGLGIYSWGYDEIIQKDPEVRGDSDHAMCACSERSWYWQQRVIDYVAQWEIDGFHLESADLGRCSCAKCMERWPVQSTYHNNITSRTAQYIRERYPDKYLAATLISWTGWNQGLDEQGRSDVIELSRHVDCVFDQGHHATYVKDEWRADFIRQMHCDYGTSGGLWVYPPYRWNRLNWFVPYPQTTGTHIQKLFADGGRGVMYYQGPVNNPSVEINIAFGGRLMLDPSRSVEEVLSGVLEDLYQPKTPAALERLTQAILAAEEGHFGNFNYAPDGIHLENLPAYPGPGELHLAFPSAGVSGKSVHLREPFLTDEGRKAYEAALQAAIREVYAIGRDFAATEKIKRLQVSMTNTMTMLLNIMNL